MTSIDTLDRTIEIQWKQSKLCVGCVIVCLFVHTLMAHIIITTHTYERTQEHTGPKVQWQKHYHLLGMIANGDIAINVVHTYKIYVLLYSVFYVDIQNSYMQTLPSCMTPSPPVRSYHNYVDL